MVLSWMFRQEPDIRVKDAAYELCLYLFENRTDNRAHS
jgi:hypothetical protein